MRGCSVLRRSRMRTTRHSSPTAKQSARAFRSLVSTCSRRSEAACFRTPSGVALPRFPEVVAIKIAPFNRYQTLDVVRAVIDARRDDIALYTGNDDAIVSDLVTRFRFRRNGAAVERRIVGGLLGHWAVWTRGAVALLGECHAAANTQQVPAALLERGVEITDANSAVLRRGSRLRRVHRGHSGSPASPGIAGECAMPGSPRDAQRRTGRRNRSRLPRVPASGRRCVRRGEPRGVDVMLRRCAVVVVSGGIRLRLWRLRMRRSQPISCCSTQGL